jgi:hypothetical protein
MENAVELTQHFSYLGHSEWYERVAEGLEGSRGVNELIITLARELDDQAQALGIEWGEDLEWIETCEALGAHVREIAAPPLTGWGPLMYRFLSHERINAQLR